MARPSTLLTGLTHAQHDSAQWRIQAAKCMSNVVQQAREQGQVLHVSLALPMPDVDPLAWVQQFEQFPAVYWGDRTGRTESISVGAAATMTEQSPSAWDAVSEKASALLSRSRPLPGTLPHRPRLYGGFAFDPADTRDSQLWSSFASAYLMFPEATYIRDPQGPRCVVTVAVAPESDADERIEFFEKQLARFTTIPAVSASQSLPKVVKVEGQDDSDAWQAVVLDALTQIANGPLEKVVLSRDLHVTLADRLPVWGVTQRLRDMSPGCYHFAYRPDRGHAFVGASPERLFRLDGRQIESECIAGTVERGVDDSDDQKLADELLASEKDRREQSYVVESSLRDLSELCVSMQADTRPRIMRLPTLQHLITCIRGTLRSDVSVGDVLRQLHPTAAVGGMPRVAALAAIRELESKPRGWYCGAVGWWEPDCAEFAVAIRSAIISETKAHVFAGAGIVSGSIPEKEWQETQNKAQAFLKVLQA